MTSDELKKSISMREIVEQYDIKIDRKGFCCCPFHKEKTASMKIYKDSYYCFGCGESGDIFTFVQKMDDVDFKTAFRNLGGTYKQHENDYKHRKYVYQIAMRKETERIKKAKKRLLKMQVLEDIHYQKLFKKLSPVFSNMWCEAVNRLEYDYYLLEELAKEEVMIFETA